MLIAVGLLVVLAFIGLLVLTSGVAWFLLSPLRFLLKQYPKMWLYEQFCTAFILTLLGTGMSYPGMAGANFTLAKIRYDRAEAQLLEEGWTKITPYCDTDWMNPHPFITLRDSGKRVIKRHMTDSQYRSFCGSYHK